MAGVNSNITIIMSTIEENQSLKDCPLPPELNIAVIDYATNCPADKVLTSILLIDAEIDKMQDALRPYVTNLGMQRERLLNRAKTEKITEDAEAILVEKKGKKFRNNISDLEAFAETFPEGYSRIREAQKKDLKDDYDKKIEQLEDSKIPLTLADDKIGKEKVTEFVGYGPQTITYEIVRK